MSSSPNIRQAVPFFRVRDMGTSMKFYISNLGFTLTNKWVPRSKIEWCWLERDEVSLMLQERKNEEKFDSEVFKRNGVSICFQCVDALALYQEFISRGADIQEPFVGNKMWVVSCTDPDGYYLDFESPTDVPEGTKYTDWYK